MLVFSCHADTGFDAHRLARNDDGTLHGHLDNFAGVHAVMNAFFSGRLDADYVRVELTYGEEEDFAGALEVRQTLAEDDMVAVVDVTGARTDLDFLVEKCGRRDLRAFLRSAFSGLACDVLAGCDDPVSTEDETDVYVERTPFVFFLGIPCTGGDYNEGRVSCREASLRAVTEAACRLAEAYPSFQPSAKADASRPPLPS